MQSLEIKEFLELKHAFIPLILLYSCFYPGYHQSLVYSIEDERNKMLS